MQWHIIEHYWFFFVDHIISIISVVELLPMRISIVEYVNYMLLV